MKRVVPIVLAGGLVIGLGGCGAVQDLGAALGVKAQDNELMAVRNPPLTIPPDYNLLPPQAGSERARSRVTSRKGKVTVLGSRARGQASARSAGESALLRKAGLRPGVDTGVRQRVDQETEQRTKSERSFADKLLKWREKGESDKKDGDSKTRRDRGADKPVIKRKGEIF